MANFKLEFRTRRVIKASQRRINSAAKKVANEMAKEIKATINIQGPPRSTPGNPPHRDSGTLFRSVKGTARNGVITISTVRYGRWLEGGAPRIRLKKRPFIRPILFSRGNRGKWTARIRKLAETK